MTRTDVDRAIQAGFHILSNKPQFVAIYAVLTLQSRRRDAWLRVSYQRQHTIFYKAYLSDDQAELLINLTNIRGDL
jgi:hypothetical protein